MRRTLIGVIVGLTAVATATPLGDQYPSPRPYAITLEGHNGQVFSWFGNAFQRQRLSEEVQQLRAELLRLQDISQRLTAPIDPEISIMDCRIVAQERLNGDQFLLTEECAWKGGRVERRRFLALRRDDGPLRGWLYQLAESDV